jgi:tRNA G18 (ribose-2'-O)-methylase SpoU
MASTFMQAHSMNTSPKKSKRKFLLLPLKERHKYCANLLRELYENETVDLTHYNALTDLLSLNPYIYTDKRSLTDRYHWHLQEAGLSLKEHHLLPNLRTKNRPAILPFSDIAIYLDDVRSPYNVGSILRTVEALRIGSVYFSKKTPFIDHEKVFRTAQGATKIVPTFQNVPLSELPRPLIALDTSDAALPLFSFSFPKTFTLILGNEEHGISDETLSQIDTIVEIPLFGDKNSINVAAAFAIAAAKIRMENFSVPSLLV